MHVPVCRLCVGVVTELPALHTEWLDSIFTANPNFAELPRIDFEPGRYAQKVFERKYLCQPRTSSNEDSPKRLFSVVTHLALTHNFVCFTSFGWKRIIVHPARTGRIATNLVSSWHLPFGHWELSLSYSSVEWGESANNGRLSSPKCFNLLTTSHGGFWNGTHHNRIQLIGTGKTLCIFTRSYTKFTTLSQRLFYTLLHS